MATQTPKGSRVHRFKEYVLDPVPDKLWRNVKPIPGTRVGFCEECGFYHVDPFFDEDFLGRYYSTYEMPTSQANLAETARLLGANLFDKDAAVYDLGCGDGQFLGEVHKLGFKNLYGVDQSPGISRAQNLSIATFKDQSLWDLIAEAKSGGGLAAEAVVMLHVLEHVVEPVALLNDLHEILKPGALVCLMVPNDFSMLQRAFLQVKGHLPWFVCLPDHQSYFNFENIGPVMDKTGFEIIDISATYPLEVYLLEDLDYIADPTKGPVAHARRVMFEDNMKAAGMTSELDHLYRTLAKGGFGRDVMLVARRRA